MIQRSLGHSGIRSCSIFTASSLVVMPSRWDSRMTWVSTTTPLGMPKAVPRTTLAVLRATPGSDNSSSSVRGTSPPNLSTIILAAARMFLALLWKKPVE